MADAKARVEAGIVPELLDKIIGSARDRLEEVVGDIGVIRTTLHPQLTELGERLTAMLAAGTLDEAGITTRVSRLVDWLEKYGRTSLTLTKVLDEVARLRSFVAGGADSRPDLSSLSDVELARIIRSQRVLADTIATPDSPQAAPAPDRPSGGR